MGVKLAEGPGGAERVPAVLVWPRCGDVWHAPPLVYS